MEIVIIRFVAILQFQCQLSVIAMTFVWVTLPTRHAPECLDTPVHIALTLKQCDPGTLNDLSLSTKICQGIGTNGLGLMGKGLAVLQSLCASIKAVRAGKQLLSLLHVDI